MRSTEAKLNDVRIELVTTTFVASGAPEGIRDLGRLLENLNNPAMSQQVLLRRATLRPLYRAVGQLELDAELLVRRDEIIFANFEGPYSAHGVVRPSSTDTPALLMAPPFQIQGTVQIAAGADTAQALRALASVFFIVRRARVYDADGVLLGEGDQILVNGGAMQMISATNRHVAAPSAIATTRDAPIADADAPAAAVNGRVKAA